MSLSWPPRDPDEAIYYLVRFGPRLAGDTIATRTVTVASGDATVDSGQIVTDAPDDEDATDYGADSAVRVKVSGGTRDTTAEVNVHVTTAGSQIFEQTVKQKIKAR